MARRGYFVEGLGGAQFALPGAVERLRASGGVELDETPPLVLAATDPAQPYGAALSWPKRDDDRRPQRVAGAYVVLAGAEPVLYVERGGKGLLTLVGDDDARIEPALRALADAVLNGRMAQARRRARGRRAGGRLALGGAPARARVPRSGRASSRSLPEGARRRRRRTRRRVTTTFPSTGAARRLVLAAVAERGRWQACEPTKAPGGAGRFNTGLSTVLVGSGHGGPHCRRQRRQHADHRRLGRAAGSWARSSRSPGARRAASPPSSSRAWTPRLAAA